MRAWAAAVLFGAFGVAEADALAPESVVVDVQPGDGELRYELAFEYALGGVQQVHLAFGDEELRELRVQDASGQTLRHRNEGGELTVALGEQRSGVAREVFVSFVQDAQLHYGLRGARWRIPWTLPGDVALRGPAFERGCPAPFELDGSHCFRSGVSGAMHYPEPASVAHWKAAIIGALCLLFYGLLAAMLHRRRALRRRGEVTWVEAENAQGYRGQQQQKVTLASVDVRGMMRRGAGAFPVLFLPALAIWAYAGWWRSFGPTEASMVAFVVGASLVSWSFRGPEEQGDAPVLGRGTWATFAVFCLGIFGVRMLWSSGMGTTLKVTAAFFGLVAVGIVAVRLDVRRGRPLRRWGNRLWPFAILLGLCSVCMPATAQAPHGFEAAAERVWVSITPRDGVADYRVAVHVRPEVLHIGQSFGNLEVMNASVTDWHGRRLEEETAMLDGADGVAPVFVMPPPEKELAARAIVFRFTQETPLNYGLAERRFVVPWASYWDARTLVEVNYPLSDGGCRHGFWPEGERCVQRRMGPFPVVIAEATSQHLVALLGATLVALLAFLGLWRTQYLRLLKARGMKTPEAPQTPNPKANYRTPALLRPRNAKVELVLSEADERWFARRVLGSSVFLLWPAAAIFCIAGHLPPLLVGALTVLVVVALFVLRTRPGARAELGSERQGSMLVFPTFVFGLLCAAMRWSGNDWSPWETLRSGRFDAVVGLSIFTCFAGFFVWIYRLRSRAPSRKTDHGGWA